MRICPAACFLLLRSSYNQCIWSYGGVLAHRSLSRHLGNKVISESLTWSPNHEPHSHKIIRISKLSRTAHWLQLIYFSIGTFNTEVLVESRFLLHCMSQRLYSTLGFDIKWFKLNLRYFRRITNKYIHLWRLGFEFFQREAYSRAYGLVCESLSR